MAKTISISESDDLQNELHRFMKLNKLKNLKEIRRIATPDLLKMEGFGYRLLIEVVLNKKVN